MSAIRHLAVSGNNTVLAAGEYESTVHLFDLTSRALVRTIQTALDYGGSRLDLSPEGFLLAAGGYTRKEVAVYCTQDGTNLWQREDLRRIQKLRFSSDGRNLYCCLDNGTCDKVDALSGKSIDSLRGIRRLWTSRREPLLLFERDKEYLISTDGVNLASIPKLVGSHAISAAFSSSEVCISESGGSVRAFCFKTGTLSWRWEPSIGYGSCLDLASLHHVDQFIGVLRAPEGYILCKFDRNSGKVLSSTSAPDAYCCEFFSSGKKLVTASGAVIDVESGLVESQIMFP